MEIINEEVKNESLIINDIQESPQSLKDGDIEM